MTLKLWSAMRCGELVFPAAVAASLVGVPVASAEMTTSSNWAGYAVHRAGVRFGEVSGDWRVPRVSCATSGPSFSALWVGLGGYSATANALEQTGTGADCSSDARPTYSAWYELVPAGPHTVLTSTTFSAAHAKTRSGRGGTIASRWWNATEIFLTPTGPTFMASEEPAESADAAAPSALTRGGSCFTVAFLGAHLGPARLAETDHLVRAGASFLGGAR